jgi:hypothetical protein
MLISKNTHRIWAAFLIAFVMAALPSSAWAQACADLEEDPGSTVTVSVEMVMTTSLFGTLGGTDADTAAVDGYVSMTLSPAQPPFADCTIELFHIEAGTLQFHYSFLFGVVQIDVTVSDLVIESTEPFVGSIDFGGNTSFPVTALRGTGSAHVVSAALGIDQIEPIDSTSNDPFSGLIIESSGMVIFGNLSIPVLQDSADPADLPPGITALTATVTTNASNTTFRGAYHNCPSCAGDINNDGFRNVSDFTLFAGTYGSHLGDPNYNPAADLNGDGYVNATDFTMFATHYGQPCS